MIILFAVMLGLLFGSFISNSLWAIRQREARAKKNKAIQSPRSVCGHCGHILSLKDLVPLFSWLSLRGRCRYCNQPLSIQYPLIELLTGVLFAWSAYIWELNTAYGYLSLGLWLLILTGLIIMAVYDLRWLELPDKVMGLTLLLAVGFAILAAMDVGNFGPIVNRLVAGLAAGSGFYSLHIMGRGKWLGGGDVKLAFLMGIILSGQKLAVAMFIGFLLAAVTSLALMSLRKLGRKDLIPFGPFLITATFLAAHYGNAIFDAYISLLSV